jgi:hypothetical protein
LLPLVLFPSLATSLFFFQLILETPVFTLRPQRLSRKVIWFRQRKCSVLLDFGLAQRKCTACTAAMTISREFPAHTRRIC